MAECRWHRRDGELCAPVTPKHREKPRGDNKHGVLATRSRQQNSHEIYVPPWEGQRYIGRAGIPTRWPRTTPTLDLHRVHGGNECELLRGGPRVHTNPMQPYPPGTSHGRTWLRAATAPRLYDNPLGRSRLTAKAKDTWGRVH
jgi:hypothetical protein